MGTPESKPDAISKPDDLLAPIRINEYRLRGETASMLVCLGAGITFWLMWILLRDSDDRTFKLLAFLGCYTGAAVLLVGLLSTITVLVHSAYCLFRYNFGIKNLALGVFALPLFSFPYYIN